MIDWAALGTDFVEFDANIEVEDDYFAGEPAKFLVNFVGSSTDPQGTVFDFVNQ